MKKQKKLHPIKKTKKWVLWVVLGGVAIITAGLSILIVSMMKSETIPSFDAANAVSIAKKLETFPNRYVGNKDHDKAKEFIFDKLKGCTDNVTEQDIAALDGATGDTVLITNIIASFYPNNPQRIMLCAHYDTPKQSVSDSAVINILGATDNVSGIAVLLELARLMKLQQPAIGVDIVFFDGTTDLSGGDTKNLFIGAQKFVQSMPDYKPKYAINLNYVGVPNLTIYADEFSKRFASDVFERLNNIAESININIFKTGKEITVADNHLILIKNRIKTVDIFAYEWQRKDNAKIDPTSLNAIGTVLVHHIY